MTPICDCRVCDVPLGPHNWYQSYQKTNRNICIPCEKARHKEYRQTDHFRAKRKAYVEENRAEINERAKGYNKRWRERNYEQWRECVRLSIAKAKARKAADPAK